MMQTAIVVSSSSPATAGHGGSETCSVQLSSRTWEHDTHGLFDFEARHAPPRSEMFHLSRTAECIRVGQEVQVVPERGVTPTGAEGLLRVIKKRGRIYVDRAARLSHSDPQPQRPWLMVRHLGAESGPGHKLQEDDTIKLGRSKFRVRRLCTTATSTGGLESLIQGTNTPACIVDVTTNELQTASCRICLLEGSSAEDPLISPCDCSGSIQHVHLGCMKHWVKTRLNVPDDGSGAFLCRPQVCELCKASLPMCVRVGDTVHNLVEVPQPTAPYLVLESTAHHTAARDRGFHVLSLAGEKPIIRLGRGHNCDLQIHDVSISRVHATIRFLEGDFILEDNRSKFGTTVALRGPWLLQNGEEVSFQVGRTVLSLRLPVAQEPGAGDDVVGTKWGTLTSGGSPGTPSLE